MGKQIKRYVYIEDHQMYYKTYWLFDTDSELSGQAMEDISWTPLCAGRISTSFETFSRLMKDTVCNAREVKEIPPGVEVITGATGNY